MTNDKQNIRIALILLAVFYIQSLPVSIDSLECKINFLVGGILSGDD